MQGMPGKLRSRLPARTRIQVCQCMKTAQKQLLTTMTAPTSWPSPAALHLGSWVCGQRRSPLPLQDHTIPVFAWCRK